MSAHRGRATGAKHPGDGKGAKDRSSANRLIFVENVEGAAMVASSMEPGTRVVALNAQAMEGLEAHNIDFAVVGDYGDPKTLLRGERRLLEDTDGLLRAAESFIAQRHESARWKGPGLLTGQTYALHVSAIAVATRVFLVRKALEALRPREAKFLVAPADYWFKADGYEGGPWVPLLESLCEAAGVRFEQQAAYPAETAPAQRASNLSMPAMIARGRGIAGRFRRRVRWGARRAGVLPHPATTKVDGLENLSVLFAGPLVYDWGPVVDALMSRRSTRLYRIEQISRGVAHPAARSFGAVLERLPSGKPTDLGVPFHIDETESRAMAASFDSWRTSKSANPRLIVDGMDVFPALVSHWRAAAAFAPAVARHAEASAAKAIDIANPDAVCFPSMPFLADGRFSHVCRERGVPVVCYQHGGAYGTHGLHQHEFTDFAFADHFLSYGEGVRVAPNPVRPVRAKFTPIGSARTEALPRSKRRRKHGDRLNVLWISEATWGNSRGGFLLQEDTHRHRLYQRGIRLLAESGRVDVVYRPFPGRTTIDGTSSWIRRTRPPGVRVAASTPASRLMEACDVAVTTTYSNTPWGEAFVLGRPLVLFLDPNTVSLATDFARDLSNACEWALTEGEFLATLERIAADPEGALVELENKRGGQFVDRYVLHRDDGLCVERGLRFLAGLRRVEHEVHA